MMTFDEGRIRIPGNNGFSTMPVRPGMTFDIETMPVRPGMTFDIETMPGKQNTDPGFDFLRSFIGQDQARTPSFDINQGQGALGRRSGEQLLRLQGGRGSMQNQQLQQELERRGIIPRGIQLPPV